MNRSTQKRNDYIRGYPVPSAAKTPPIIAPGILCPKCKGQMLDERQSKRSEKSPDYVCSNMLCTDASGKYRTAIWEKDTNKNGSTPAATVPAGGSSGSVGAPAGAAVEKPTMREAYKSLTKWVLTEIGPIYDEAFNAEVFNADVAAACVQTLFIQACQSGKVE